MVRGILHNIIPSQYQVFSQIDLSIERHWPIWQKGKARCFRSRSPISTMKIKCCQLQLQPCPQLVTVYTNNYKQLELAVLRGNTPSILSAVQLPWWMEHAPPPSLPPPFSLPSLPISLPTPPLSLPRPPLSLSPPSSLPPSPPPSSCLLSPFSPHLLSWARGRREETSGIFCFIQAAWGQHQQQQFGCPSRCLRAAFLMGILESCLSLMCPKGWRTRSETMLHAQSCDFVYLLDLL